MKEHVLKCWPESYDVIVSGRKTYEIRQDDRDYQVDDLLVLQKFEPCAACKGTGRVWGNGDMEDCSKSEKPHGVYLGVRCQVRITHITRGGAWGLPASICVLGLGSKREVYETIA